MICHDWAGNRSSERTAPSRAARVVECGMRQGQASCSSRTGFPRFDVCVLIRSGAREAVAGVGVDHMRSVVSGGGERSRGSAERVARVNERATVRKRSFVNAISARFPLRPADRAGQSAGRRRRRPAGRPGPILVGDRRPVVDLRPVPGCRRSSSIRAAYLQLRGHFGEPGHPLLVAHRDTDLTRSELCTNIRLHTNMTCLTAAATRSPSSWRRSYRPSPDPRVVRPPGTARRLP
jgi:hypothetical protein